MASRLTMFRRLCSRALHTSSKQCTSVSLLLVAACAVDELSPSTDKQKPLQLLAPKEMTNDALIKQACTLHANSSSQLLTQVLIAICDTSQEYRKSMSDLMTLLDASILLITNSTSSSVLLDIEESIVHQRSIVEGQRGLILEFVTLMDYVEKAVTSAAETAFLAGAEQSSTLICERLNSALRKVVEECATNKHTEEELLRLQELYVIKLGELQRKESEEILNDQSKEGQGEIADMNRIVPINIFDGTIDDTESNNGRDFSE